MMVMAVRGPGMFVVRSPSMGTSRSVSGLSVVAGDRREVGMVLRTDVGGRDHIGERMIHGVHDDASGLLQLEELMGGVVLVTLGGHALVAHVVVCMSTRISILPFAY